MTTSNTASSTPSPTAATSSTMQPTTHISSDPSSSAAELPSTAPYSATPQFPSTADSSSTPRPSSAIHSSRSDTFPAFADLCNMEDNLLHLAEVEYQLHQAAIDKVRKRALGITEICSEIIEYLDDYELFEAIQAGGPFYNTVRGSAILSKDMGFEYDHEWHAWYPSDIRLGLMFWDSLSSGCPRRSGCAHRCYETVDTTDGDRAYEILPMVIDSSGDITPKEVRFSNEGALVKATGSRGVFPDMRLGARPETFKLVVENMDKNEEYGALSGQWRAPPIALKWVTAELLIDTTNLRMYSIYRIARSPYECANRIDEKMLKEQAFDWDEEKGAVTDPKLKSFFHESDLQAVVSDGGPKYFWFWARDGVHPL